MNCPRKIPANRIAAAFLLVCAFMGTVSGCGLFAKDYAAIVNGEKIPVRDFEDRLQVKMALMENSSSIGRQEAGRIRAELLNEMIDEKLMITRALALKLNVSQEELDKKLEEIKADYPEGLEKFFQGRADDYKRWKEALKTRILLEKVIEQDVNAGVLVSDDEALAFFKANSNYGSSENRVRVSQIVLSDRAAAETALKRLKAGENFSVVAKELSTGPEASRGGDMGWFTRGSLPETIENVVFKLKPGQVSRILESPYGYHIFEVEKTEKAGKASFSEVKERIRADLKKEKEGAAYREWLKRLRKEATVEINEAALAVPSK